MTKLRFQKWDKSKPGMAGFIGSASVIVEHCPWMDFDGENKRNPEVKRLLADGYELTAHIDGVTA